VERALFCLCLEDFTPESPLAASDQLLHGDGGNRWFDKSVSLIVFADGTTVISFLDAMLEAPSPPSGDGTSAVRPVTFALDDALRADVRTADDAFAGALVNAVRELEELVGDDS
jgi:carnitine O-acetyltransferase